MLNRLLSGDRPRNRWLAWSSSRCGRLALTRFIFPGTSR